MPWPGDTVIDPLLTGWDFPAFDAATIFTAGWFDLYQDPLPSSSSGFGPYRPYDPRFSPLVWLLKHSLRRW